MHDTSRPPHSNGFWKKIMAIAVLLILVAVGYYATQDELTLVKLAQHEDRLQAFQIHHPISVYALAFCFYVAVTTLSLPGAAMMSLVIGWYFGFWRGVIFVSFASTTGATLAFLLSRYLLRNVIQSWFGDRLKTFNESLDREGAFYLFTLRLIPVVPFFAINLVMGLTRIRVRTFWWVSQLGMLAGTCVYVYAGSTVPRLEQLTNPARLQTQDVHDWLGFVQKLKRGADPNSTGGVQRLWQSLSNERQGRVFRLADGEMPLDEPTQADLIATLTRIMQTVPLDPQTPAPAKPVPAASQSGHEEETQIYQKRLRAWHRQMTEVNREIMVKEFPEHVRRPRPILSVQLLTAFAALGLSPILVKKIVERMRQSKQPSTS